MAAYFEQVLGGTYDNHVLPFLWLKGEARETITEYLEQIAGADIRRFAWNRARIPISVATAGGLTCALSSASASAWG